MFFKGILWSVLLALALVTSGFSQDSEKDHALSILKNPQCVEDLSERLNLVLKAYDVAKEIDDSTSIATATYHIATCNFFTGNYDTALFTFQDYLKIGSTWCDSMRIEDSHFYSGVIYVMKQNWSAALPHILNAVDYSLASGDHYNLGDSYNMLGYIYTNLVPGQMKQSVAYHYKALEEFKAMKLSEGLGRTYSFLGENYQKAQMIDSAIASYRRSLHYFKDDNDSTGLGISNKNIGLCYLDLEKWDSAYVYIKRSMPFLNIDDNHANNQMMYYQSFVSLAEIYLMKGNIEEAEKNLKFYINGVPDTSMSMYLEEYLSVKSMLEYAKGNYAQAHLDYKRSSEIKDSIFNEERTAQLLGIMELYQSEAKDKKLARQEEAIIETTLKAELEAKKRKEADEKKRVILRILISVVVVGVFVLLWLRQKRRANRAHQKLLEHHLELEQKEAERLKEELRFKTQSLTSYSILVAQKNEILQKLNSWVREHHAEIDSAGDMLSLIRSGRSFDNEWEEFRILFDEVHQGYIDRITRNYPELTPNEVRLCALLKLNLSSKQMASILNIAPRSVDVSRSRLRKKLGISASENLVDYMSKL